MSESERTQGTADPAQGITMLEGSLWRQLTRALESEAAAKSWAPLMYAQIQQAELCCAFIKNPEDGRLRMTANWPEARLATSATIAAAEEAVAGNHGVVRGYSEDTFGEMVSIASPLTLDGTPLGAVAIEFVPQSNADLKSAMRQLQWGAAWLRDHLRREEALEKTARYKMAIEALGTVVTVAENEDIATAARAAATDLATRFGCDRVSIGFRRLRGVAVTAISHSSQFGKRMNLVRQLGAAMDEAVDQRGVVLFPGDNIEPPRATHRHEKLAQSHSIGWVLTVPLFASDRFIGAVVFERPSNKPFSQDETELLEAVCTVIAPVLEEKRRNDRWLITKVFEILGSHIRRLVGPGRFGRKLFVIAIAALAIFFWYAKGEDRVAANAVVEGELQRSIAAPFDSYIAESFARAGDYVEQGDLLVRLDDRELALERLRLASVLQRQKIEFDRALAESNRAQTSIYRNQIEQSETEILLVDQQLARTRLTAPFSGLVTSGDLSQSIGSAVELGAALLTIVPAENYRIVLRIDEARISDMKLGLPGSLLVTALPEDSFDIRVTKITPVAEYGDGATTFRVEASLDGDHAGLQPGMEGIAKVDIGERRLIAIWTQPMMDWAKLWAWRWLNWE